MSIKTKRWARAAVVALSVTTIACASTHVYAQPSSKELEQKTNDLNNTLNDLNGEQSSLLKEMEQLSADAEAMSSKMEETQARLDEAQIRGEQQYEDMKLRIKYMYEAGNTSFIELLCSAESMSDFLNKTDFIENVSRYDREMMDELLETQNEIKEQNEKLISEHEALVAKQEELKAKREQVEEMIASTSSELSSYKAQLDRARQAEALATQKALEEKQAAQQQQSGHSVPPAQQVTASTEGKKKLGTFHITHYCPCYACCGIWSGGLTASGTVPTPGRTIGVDTRVIPMGTRVIINGQVYVAEDTGGAIRGNAIDIFKATHSEALASGTYYADVYLAD